MPLYMTQFQYTNDAWHDLIANPKDREAGISTLLASMSGRLLGLYYTMGDHDGFILYEAPDAAAASAGVMAALGAGHLKSARTTSVFTMEEMMEIWKMASGRHYSAPQDQLEEGAF